VLLKIPIGILTGSRTFIKLAELSLIGGLFHRFVVFRGAGTSDDSTSAASKQPTTVAAATASFSSSVDSSATLGGASTGKMPSERKLKSMKSFRRTSTNEDFIVENDQPMPDLPEGGAVIKVSFTSVVTLNWMW